jgi:ferredoxin
MNALDEDVELAERLRAFAAKGTIARSSPNLREQFAARLKKVASNPDAVPIELNRRKLEARRGGTLLAAALKNGVRLMHVCGARTLCSTCRIKVIAGSENLTQMNPLERLSLRYHLSMSPRTRLACQARVLGPVEVENVFPLCGDLPNGG